jgi:aconitate hydratase
MLRKKGVVGKFVEFYGDGVGALSWPIVPPSRTWRPNTGRPSASSPIDEKSLDYLRMTNRAPEQIELVEAYAREQGLFRLDGAPEPVYTDTLSLELSTVVPSLAGPKRPQDRINLPDVKKNFLDSLAAEPKTNGIVQDGSVVIAAITSCTNTSNPSVLVAGGLVSKEGRRVWA